LAADDDTVTHKQSKQWYDRAAEMRTLSDTMKSEEVGELGRSDALACNKTAFAADATYTRA
jgi:hypothetical protein